MHNAGRQQQLKSDWFFDKKPNKIVIPPAAVFPFSHQVGTITPFKVSLLYIYALQVFSRQWTWDVSSPGVRETVCPSADRTGPNPFTDELNFP